MPIVRVEMLTGAARAEGAAGRGDHPRDDRHAKAKPEDTNIVFQDVERGDWAVAGRLMSQR